MANIFFNGLIANMSSGNTLGVYAPIDRTQSVRVEYQIPRANIYTLGRFKPLPDRPVINYTPVTMSVDYIKGDKNVETCLGILNSTGVATLIGNGTKVTDWGCRTYPCYLAPVSQPNNVGEYDVVSGVLKSWGIQGTVNEPVRASFSVDALDLQQVVNNNAKTTPNYSGQLIRFQDSTLTGIDFTGLGYSGLIIQSFSFNTSFSYASDFQIGKQYPARRMTEASASLQLSAYIDGVTSTVTGLNVFSCGSPLSGIYTLTLQPSCAGNQAPTVINLYYPYLESQSFGAQVGNFIQISLAFSIPLTISAYEATGLAGLNSNCTIT